LPVADWLSICTQLASFAPKVTTAACGGGKRAAGGSETVKAPGPPAAHGQAGLITSESNSSSALRFSARHSRPPRRTPHLHR